MNWFSVFWGYCGLAAFRYWAYGHYDCGDDESGHLSFRSDTNLLCFLPSPLVILVGPNQPWQTNLLCWEPPWLVFLPFFEMFPVQAVISLWSDRECNWRSLHFQWPVRLDSIGLSGLALLTPGLDTLSQKTGCAINIRTMESFSNRAWQWRM